MGGDGVTVRRNGLPMRYLLVVWLMVMGGIAFMDRTNISIAGIELGREYHIDNAHLGWVFSAFLIGYATFQVPGGMLARRFGPRKVLTWGVIWWGIFTALTAAAPAGAPGALLMLILIRVALGAGEAVMFPAANQFEERWIPMAERGRSNGIIFGGVGLGSALAPPLLTAIILRYGWHVSFWFCAVLGVLAGIVWYVAARNTPEEHPWVSTREIEHIARGRGDVNGAAKKTDHKKRTPWGRILASRNFVAITGSYFSYGYISWIFFSWFYIYLSQVRGLSLKTSAWYSMLPFLAMSLGCLLGGAASDWLAVHVSERAGRSYLPCFALLLTGTLLAAGANAHSAVAASLVLAGGAGALYMSQSCYFSVTSDFAGDYTGPVSGAMNMGGQIGGAVTASVTPLIAMHFGWIASFVTAAVLALLGGLAWLLVDPGARLERTEQPLTELAERPS
ncbi:MAG TPA: MFS transporter [Terracidiphilus sp.]|nr:MFS transporter [Terracidiphilus sp.]